MGVVGEEVHVAFVLGLGTNGLVITVRVPNTLLLNQHQQTTCSYRHAL